MISAHIMTSTLLIVFILKEHNESLFLSNILKQTKFLLMYVCMTRMELHNYIHIAMNYLSTSRGATLDVYREKRNNNRPILLKKCIFDLIK